MSDSSRKGEPPRSAVYFISVITPQPGKLDEFITIQQASLPALGKQIAGLRDSQLHKSLDGEKAVMVVGFDSIEDHQSWLKSEAFAAHQKKVGPLIAAMDRGYFEKAYDASRA